MTKKNIDKYKLARRLIIISVQLCTMLLIISAFIIGWQRVLAILLVIYMVYCLVCAGSLYYLERLIKKDAQSEK